MFCLQKRRSTFHLVVLVGCGLAHSCFSIMTCFSEKIHKAMLQRRERWGLQRPLPLPSSSCLQKYAARTASHVVHTLLICPHVSVWYVFQSSSSFFQKRKIFLIITVSQPVTFFIFSCEEDKFTQPFEATLNTWLTFLSHFLFKLIALLRYECASLNR